MLINLIWEIVNHFIERVANLTSTSCAVNEVEFGVLEYSNAIHFPGILNIFTNTSLQSSYNNFFLADAADYVSQLSEPNPLVEVLDDASYLDLVLGFRDGISASTKVLNTHTWTLTSFFSIFYLIMVFSLALYSLPLILPSSLIAAFRNSTNYIHVTFESFYKFLLTPTIFVAVLLFIWSSSITYAWFGQLTLAPMQRAITLLCALSFLLTTYIYSTNLFFNTKEVYDFIIVISNAFVWTFFLFYANNIFIVVFLVEILTTLTVLTLVTSSFSSSYSYDLGNFSKSLYFQSLMPKSILTSLIFFFWMSLLSSLTLFLFLLFFYTSVFTFEFSLAEVCLNYLSLTTTSTQFLTTLLVLFLFTLIIFLKCGLVPLFIWKPIVFKGLTLHTIFFYICFYYYFLLTFMIYAILIDLHDILWFNKVPFCCALVVGSFTLFSILLESYYLKSFLAMSSILNTLLIFIGLVTLPNTTCFFTL